MTILAAILLMIVLLAIGRRSVALGPKQYLLIALVTLAQIGLIIVYMYTMQPPAQP